MSEKKISITRESVESMDKPMLKDVVYSLYNDNVVLLNKVKELEGIIANIEELRRLANAKNYLPSTEAVQLLFPELEAIIKYAEEVTEGKAEESSAAKEEKTRKKRTIGMVFPANTPIFTDDYTTDAPETIEKDGIVYKRGEDEVVLKLCYRPSERRLVKAIYPTWVTDVEVEGTEEKKIVGFNNAKTDALSCDASMVANIVFQKYYNSCPLYRYSETCKEQGLNLSRQTMSNWLITYYGELTGFDRYFREQVFKMRVLNQDETPIEVLDVKSESGRTSSNSFVLIRVGTTFDEEKRVYRRVINYFYSIGRTRECLFDGFKKACFNGPLLTDGLKGYMDDNRIYQKRHAVCWTHAVRHFKNYARLNKKDMKVFKLLNLHSQLYTIDKNCRKELHKGEISAEEFIDKRKKMTKPIIDSIFEMVDKEFGKLVTSAELQKGLDYLRFYKDNLYVYLDYVELTPDNNVCENAARRIAVGRHNWLFCKSIDGADASCFFYSLLMSAKECGLNAERYMEFVLRFGPTTEEKDYDSLLPWNADLSRLDFYDKAIREARPDEERIGDYILTGFSR
ncbi:MAG: IS66 family transposase [Spirochaetales bacterium]|nr:IS66 family transposase [Spirochaetales bacterium]